MINPSTRLIAFATLCTLSSAATAGDGSGLITKLTAYGSVVVFSVADHATKAPCNPDGAFVIDASTADGKTMYATLLTAVSADKPVFIYSSNSCPSWWANSESPNSVTITP